MSEEAGRRLGKAIKALLDEKVLGMQLHRELTPDPNLNPTNLHGVANYRIPGILAQQRLGIPFHAMTFLECKTNLALLQLCATVVLGQILDLDWSTIAPEECKQTLVDLAGCLIQVITLE